MPGPNTDPAVRSALPPCSFDQRSLVPQTHARIRTSPSRAAFACTTPAASLMLGPPTKPCTLEWPRQSHRLLVALRLGPLPTAPLQSALACLRGCSRRHLLAHLRPLGAPVTTHRACPGGRRPEGLVFLHASASRGVGVAPERCDQLPLLRRPASLRHLCFRFHARSLCRFEQHDTKTPRTKAAAARPLPPCLPHTLHAHAPCHA